MDSLPGQPGYYGFRLSWLSILSTTDTNTLSITVKKTIVTKFKNVYRFQPGRILLLRIISLYLMRSSAFSFFSPLYKISFSFQFGSSILFFLGLQFFTWKSSLNFSVIPSYSSLFPSLVIQVLFGSFSLHCHRGPQSQTVKHQKN